MKINQKDFTILFGAFNILGQLNLKIVKYAEDKARVNSLTKAFDAQAIKFKLLFEALDPDQQAIIDGIEFGLTGYSFTSYSEFAASVVIPVIEEVVYEEYVEEIV